MSRLLSWFVFITLLSTLLPSWAQAPVDRGMSERRFYANSYALLIGINAYQHVRNLDYSVNDVDALRGELIHDYGYRPENIITLTDARASKEGILRALNSLTDTRRVAHEDRVLIYFSGYGQTLKAADGHPQGYLVPSDAVVALTDLQHPSAYQQTCIPMDTIWEILNHCPAKHVLLIADSCFSGLRAKPHDFSKSLPAIMASHPNARPLEIVEKFAAVPARQVITAGNSGEQTSLHKEWVHRAFTKLLLDQLHAYAASPGKVVTSGELFLSLKRGMNDLTGGRQTPQFADRGTDGEFLFVVPGGFPIGPPHQTPGVESERPHEIGSGQPHGIGSEQSHGTGSEQPHGTEYERPHGIVSEQPHEVPVIVAPRPPVQVVVEQNVPPQFTNLAGLIAATPPGDTLKLEGGEYQINDEITLDKSITLIGAGSERTIIHSYASGCTLSMHRPHELRISNVTIRYEGDKPADVIGATDGNVVIAQCTLTGGKRTNDFVSGHGILVSGNAHATIIDSRLSNNEGCGIAFDKSAQGAANGNNCRENGEHGITVHASAQVSLEHNLCEHNQWCGIALGDSSRASAKNNVCQENSQDGINVSDSAEVLLSGNQCKRDQRCGILLGKSSKGLLRDNQCQENHADGIAATGASRVSLQGNACVKNAGCGLLFSDKCACDLVKDNIFSGNKYGVVTHEGIHIHFDANTFNNNRVKDVEQR